MFKLILAFLFTMTAFISGVQLFDLKAGDPAALHCLVRLYGAMICAILLGISVQVDAIHEKKH